MIEKNNIYDLCWIYGCTSFLIMIFLVKCKCLRKFSIYRLGNSNSLLRFWYLQWPLASLRSLAMQILLLKKFSTAFLFPNLKELVPLVLQFHFLVLWLCRMFLMFFHNVNFIVLSIFISHFCWHYIFSTGTIFSCTLRWCFLGKYHDLSVE